MIKKSFQRNVGNFGEKCVAEIRKFLEFVGEPFARFVRAVNRNFIEASCSVCGALMFVVRAKNIKAA